MRTTLYQLISETRPVAPVSSEYQWHFVLEATDGSSRLDVADVEPGAPTDRLELLAVVRGLEALDQPSRVTLMTPSRYVSHGLKYGLRDWRESGWRWESFGQMTPIKNEDLWRRVDQALSIHRVRSVAWRPDAAHLAVPASKRRRGVDVEMGMSPARTPPRNLSVPSAGAWQAARQQVASWFVGLGELIAPREMALIEN